MPNYPPNTIDWQPGDLVICDADAKRPKSIAKYIGQIEIPERYYFRYLYDGQEGYVADLGQLHSPLAFPETREWFLRQIDLRRGEAGHVGDIPFAAYLPACKQTAPCFATTLAWREHLSRLFGFTIAEVGEQMDALAKLITEPLDPDQVGKISRSTLLLRQAANLDATEAAQLMVSAIRAYGLASRKEA